MYLELGLIKPRHILTIRRMMYHYHIITRENCETIKKVYLNQIEGSLKGDWVQTCEKDFQFLKERQSYEEKI